MKYEIINPSDECFIYADDERLAKIACAILGNGWYGLVNEENGETVLPVLEDLKSSVGMNDDELKKFIADNRMELANVFLSFVYPHERTSCNDIGGRAKYIGDQLMKKAKEERGEDNV